MRRVQSLEINQNSSASLTQQTKKVSLPAEHETDLSRKFSSGWIRRSAPNIPSRNTIVPITTVEDEIPNYFESTMQSMCLAFFTFAYTELIDGAVFLGHVIIIQAFFKFLTILSIGLTLVAAFSSIRVLIFNSSMEKKLSRDSSKVYSTLAKFGSITAALTCATIICLFAAISLYRTLNARNL